MSHDDHVAQAKLMRNTTALVRVRQPSGASLRLRPLMRPRPATDADEWFTMELHPEPELFAAWWRTARRAATRTPLDERVRDWCTETFGRLPRAIVWQPPGGMRDHHYVLFGDNAELVAAKLVWPTAFSGAEDWD